MNIKYYADNDTMGDTSEEDCDAFRIWAATQLRTEYPDHIIQVINGPSLEQFQTDDEENREAIADFCARLWDRCPWPLLQPRPTDGPQPEKTMNALLATVTRAAELAYEEDADQIVGRIDGAWAIADREDIARLTQMTRPMFIAHSWGLDAADVMASMEEAGIDGDQDLENGTTTYRLDGETMIVNNARVWFWLGGEDA
jgi:hypothetical protein